MVGKTRELEKTDMIFFLRKFCSLLLLITTITIATMLNIYTQKKCSSIEMPQHIRNMPLMYQHTTR